MLCKSAGVTIWHIHQLKTPEVNVDIGLIKEEANELRSMSALYVDCHVQRCLHLVRMWLIL